MPRRTRVTRPLVVAASMVIAVALVGAACAGEDSNGEDASVPTTIAETSTTVESPSDAAPVPSPGCSDPLTDELSAARIDMTVGGEERYYLLSAPDTSSSDDEASAATPIPLVVDLHGLAEGAQIHTVMSKMGEYGQAHGFVTAYPHGRGEPVRWEANPAPEPNFDLEFIDVMLDQIGASRCIDESRTYVTGLSYGAIMTSFLGCVRADRFAAIAPVEGIAMPDPCDPGRPVPVLTTHGTADPILRFNGGVDLGGVFGTPDDSADATTTTTIPIDLEGPGYPEVVARWAALNGCEDSFSDSEVTESVIHRVYDCPADGPVEFYIVIGGGHAWPGSEFSAGIEEIVGPTTFDIDMNELIWDFFQQFSLE